jgi:hypothetical protein
MSVSAPEPESRNYLFVCGAPRSGTTAIAQLLNRHPKIVVGIERYKNLKPADLGEHLFAVERFFDFRPTDTNVRARNVYSRLEKKYRNTTWRGDKVPRYYTRYDTLFEKFEKSVVIFMLRDVHAVASSWNKRAEDPEDKWPEGNNYVQAVKEWNASLSLTLESKEKYGDRMLVVEYERLFSGDADVLHGILRKMKLQAPKVLLRQFEIMTRDWEKRTQKPSSVRDGQARFVDANADLQSYSKLKSFADRDALPQGELHRAGKKAPPIKRNNDMDFI